MNYGMDVRTQQSAIVEHLKKNRKEYDIKQILNELGYDVSEGTELFQRLSTMSSSVEYNPTRKTFKYKPKTNATNIEELINIIHDSKFKSVPRSTLDDAYPDVEKDLASMVEHPEKYDIVVVEEGGRSKEIYFFSDPKKRLLHDLPNLDREIVGKWKELSGTKDEDFEKTVKESHLIPYHYSAQNSIKKSRKD
ncbi:hypothetical protein EDI_256820 [Entamoeba dispar SAW760]|uniref:TFIIE beta domain-containing protein n=1 Tax=Entamoeba dispar (strain ATCC PRA-260 / SAW760) TaxID=370354 RepID=B0EHN2_ENTDS|nr:uncharacterized protein EDI_256820 [Entamoeba dispar SAW760]XP_001738386.1 uncharacterized protein EDI_165920 [Entamoeba dispar SAW760]EDR25330.1 hypothetical protein EDI_165920 [Entamoeba dispar SAW760]EDR25966.1 hypothetical protein EDI_256820 [Entamoeba dispar SAW760]|eukprot:EDR25330.1 hypothetical protein EDI_165920 [Entamoeba dispar SAW760]